MCGPILVVGADGLIGRALRNRLAAAGNEVIATTRRTSAAEGGRLQLDLARPGEWKLPDSCATAVLCAAATNLAFCREHPEEARRINVDNTLALARALSERGAFVVFLSTNLVFDGETPRTPAEAPLEPRTVYGEFKAEAELGLADGAPRCAVIRLSKVFAPDMPLLKGWRESLIAGSSLDAFTDYRCAPIDLATTVRGIGDVAVGGREGVWQFSPKEDVSYAEIAVEVAARLNPGENRVRSIPSSEKTTLEHIPRHTTLDASRARQELGLEFPAMPEVLDRVLDS